MLGSVGGFVSCLGWGRARREENSRSGSFVLAPGGGFVFSCWALLQTRPTTTKTAQGSSAVVEFGCCRVVVLALRSVWAPPARLFSRVEDGALQQQRGAVGVVQGVEGRVEGAPALASAAQRQGASPLLRRACRRHPVHQQQPLELQPRWGGRARGGACWSVVSGKLARGSSLQVVVVGVWRRA